jgi:hypothetical protein
MAARFHRPLKVIAFNVNGIGRQRYELRKQLQDLHIDVALLSETHLKPHERFFIPNYHIYRTLWSSGQSFWLQIQRSWVRLPALPDFLRGSGSGTGSTQPREYS